MPSNLELEYQKKLARHQQLSKDHEHCIGKTYNQFGLFVKCLDCEETDIDEELRVSRLDNEHQMNVCKTCEENTLLTLIDGVCGACADETHTYDFEFGEAREHWSSFTW